MWQTLFPDNYCSPLKSQSCGTTCQLPHILCVLRGKDQIPHPATSFSLALFPFTRQGSVQLPSLLGRVRITWHPVFTTIRTPAILFRNHPVPCLCLQLCSPTVHGHLPSTEAGNSETQQAFIESLTFLSPLGLQTCCSLCLKYSSSFIVCRFLSA